MHYSHEAKQWKPNVAGGDVGTILVLCGLFSREASSPKTAHNMPIEVLPIARCRGGTEKHVEKALDTHNAPTEPCPTSPQQKDAAIQEQASVGRRAPYDHTATRRDE